MSASCNVAYVVVHNTLNDGSLEISTPHRVAFLESLPAMRLKSENEQRLKVNFGCCTETQLVALARKFLSGLETNKFT